MLQLSQLLVSRRFSIMPVTISLLRRSLLADRYCRLASLLSHSLFDALRSFRGIRPFEDRARLQRYGSAPEPRISFAAFLRPAHRAATAFPLRVKKLDDILLFTTPWIVALVLCSISGAQANGATVTTRVTGAANWNTASTWIQNRTGTLAVQKNKVNVVGTGTLFTTELSV